MTLVLKLVNAANSVSDRFDFCVTSGRIDLYGDIVVARGLMHSASIIALWNHNHDTPIGTFDNFSLVGDELHAQLRFAPDGISSKITELKHLVIAGVINSCSIGFVPIETEPIITNGRRTGSKFVRARLCEISLVSCPANLDAVAAAKSLKISDAMMREVFKTMPQDSIGEKIRKARRIVALAREELARTTNPNSRMTLLKKIAQLEQLDAEQVAISRGDRAAQLARETRESLARLTKTIEPRLATIRMQISELWERYSIAVLKKDFPLQLKLQREIEKLEKTEGQYERMIGKKPAPPKPPTRSIYHSRWTDEKEQQRKAAEARSAKFGAQMEADWERQRDADARQAFEDYRIEEFNRRKK